MRVKMMKYITHKNRHPKMTEIKSKHEENLMLGYSLGIHTWASAIMFLVRFIQS